LQTRHNDADGDPVREHGTGLAWTQSATMPVRSRKFRYETVWARVASPVIAMPIAKRARIGRL
jgi:hypothetical protein